MDSGRAVVAAAKTAAPSSSSDGVRIITYKRRRLSKSSTPEGGGASAKNMMPGAKRATLSSTSSGLQQQRAHANWSCWRTFLQCVLQLPQIIISEDVRSSILNALANGPTKSTQILKDCSCDTSKPDSEDEQCDIKVQCSEFDGLSAGVSTTSRIRNRRNTDASASTCQNGFFDIIISEQFAKLCELFSNSPKESSSQTVIDFSKINLKAKNGDYARAPSLFLSDVQQIFQKFEDVGKQMVILGNSLPAMLMTYFESQVGSVLEVGTDIQNTELHEKCYGDKVTKDSTTTTTQLTSCDSGHSTRPDQPEGSALYKFNICKLCNCEADASGNLICDGCEGTFHVSCVEPSMSEVPTQNWFCSSCSRQRASGLAVLGAADHEGLHENCAVCSRLEVSRQIEVGSRSNKEIEDAHERSVSSTEEEESPELSTTARSRLCKHCGACEDDDKKFLVCGHKFCLYKYYHIRCLKSSQIASAQQQNRACWYCPSCLCRKCFADKDDDKIVLCDGCDDAYHIYCMKFPRTTIPTGQWYCHPCNEERARQGMKQYDEIVLHKHMSSKQQDKTPCLRRRNR